MPQHGVVGSAPTRTKHILTCLSLIVKGLASHGEDGWDVKPYNMSVKQEQDASSHHFCLLFRNVDVLKNLSN